MAEGPSQVKKKPEKQVEQRTLQNTVVPKMKELIGGKLGEVFVEGLILVESTARLGREGLEKRLNERMVTLNAEASAASKDASDAKASATRAETNSSNLLDKATEMETSVSRLNTTVETVESLVGKAKTTADSAFKEVTRVLNALRVKIGVAPNETELTGSDAFEWMVRTIKILKSAHGKNKDDIKELREEVDEVKKTAKEQGESGDQRDDFIVAILDALTENNIPVDLESLEEGGKS